MKPSSVLRTLIPCAHVLDSDWFKHTHAHTHTHTAPEAGVVCTVMTCTLTSFPTPSLSDFFRPVIARSDCSEGSNCQHITSHHTKHDCRPIKSYLSHKLLCFLCERALAGLTDLHTTMICLPSFLPSINSYLELCCQLQNALRLAEKSASDFIVFLKILGWLLVQTCNSAVQRRDHVGNSSKRTVVQSIHHLLFPPKMRTRRHKPFVNGASGCKEL